MCPDCCAVFIVTFSVYQLEIVCVRVVLEHGWLGLVIVFNNRPLVVFHFADLEGC